jgi:hypothetical protein
MLALGTAAFNPTAQLEVKAGTIGVVSAIIDTVAGQTANAFKININGTNRLNLDINGNLTMTGGGGTGQSNIILGTTANLSYDTNLILSDSTAKTMGIVCGSTAAFSATYGPFVAMRGITYSAIAGQRGLLSLCAGSPSTPTGDEGAIIFGSGASGTTRMKISVAGVVSIPTPTSNKFVAGGTAALGSASATFISDSGGFNPVSIQNTNINAWSQIDIYSSAAVVVAGFGYANATAGTHANRAYFYTAAKDFHFSTDSSATRHFILAATSGVATFAPKASTSGAPVSFTVTSPANTSLTLSTEVPAFLFDSSATKQWATGALASQFEFKILAPTYSFIGSSTVSLCSTFYISGAPIAGTNATISIGHALYVNSGSSRFGGRILATKGADVASANDCTLGTDGNCFAITGTTTINGLASDGWIAGSEVTLLFGSAVTLKHNTAASAGFVSMKLSGAADFSATDGDTLKLVYTGTFWVEVSRTVI